MKKHFPLIAIIPFEKNYGFAQGYNRACALIDSEVGLYGFINNDIEVTTDWLSPIITLFETREDVAVAQPKICDYYKRSFFEYAGAAGGYLDALGYAYCRGRLFSTLEEDTSQYRDTEDLHWASGSCFFIRAAVFKSLKGFDVNFFMHQEEIDLCWRVKGGGYKIACAVDSKVFHVGGGTLAQDNPRKTYYNFRNSLLMLAKNLPWYQLYPVIFLRLILDGLAGVHFIGQQRYKSVLAVVRAHLGFYFYLPRYIFHPSSGRISRYVTSVVWVYFFKRKRFFHQLTGHQTETDT